MRICLWSSSSFEEWYSSYHLMLQIIKDMTRLGHQVMLVQQQKCNGAVPDEIRNNSLVSIKNVIVTSFSKSSFVKRYLGSIKYFLDSSKVIGKEIHNIDVIFLQSNNTAFIPVRCARNWKIPILYNVQDIFPIDALVVGKLSKYNPIFVMTRYLQAWAYKKADRVVTISEDMKKTIQSEGRKDVDVIYNWSYQNEPYNIPDEKNHFLLSHGIKRDDEFRVVYAGNVGQMLDVEMLIQIAILLRNEKSIKIYIIGEGSALAKLKKRSKEEILNNVLCFKRQPMKYAPDNYCMADVIINPIPKDVIYTCMPSKTATCLLSEQPTVVSMDLDSDMAKRLSTVDQWTVVAPNDAKAMKDAILKVYVNGSQKSSNAANFLFNLGSVENAKQYVRILKEASEQG